MNTPPTLDRFETALLRELRAHVATRPAVAPPVPEVPRRRHRRRWAAGLVAAAATATAYVVVSPGGPVVSPAYAIDETADGDVVVTVHRLEDAAGLEAALREHGIDASVSFDPDDALSPELTIPDPDGDIPPPPDDAEDSVGGTGERHEGGSDFTKLESVEEGDITEAEPREGPMDDPDPAGCGIDKDSAPATLTQEGGDWVLRIPATSPLQDREVHITTSADGGLAVAYPGDEPNSYCAVASMG